ncbi:MAG: hypothetical protein ABIQ86_06360 [Steroidobacteraceae bacterium]
MNSITVLFRATGAVAVVLLAACSSGGSISIGSGQGADPGTVDFPIAYVKRTIPVNPEDLRQQRNTTADADLFFRDRAAPSSVERNITQRVTGNNPYDIKDVDVSPDGRKIVFAMRGPLAANQNEEAAPNWQIWEYEILTDTLRRVIGSDIVAAEGNDIGPQYLPDGRLLFTSTRQRQSKAILLDESKPAFEAQVENRSESAFALHVMDADGGNIHQITFNQSHDLWPTVMADGRVLFTRWTQARGMHLYSTNPDGTDVQLLYGALSHRTGTADANGPTNIQFTRPREMQNGRILTLTRPFTNSDFGGDLVMIDTRSYVENTQPLAASAGLAGPAQTRATPNEVSTIQGPSVGGRFRSAFPLWDGSNRILVSWSQCRLLDNTVTPAVIVPCTSARLADPNVQTSPSLYSAFVFDPAGNTFKPLFQPVEGVMITDLVAAQPRVPPSVRLDHTVAAADFDPTLIGEGVGVLEIRSVYDFNGVVASAGAPDIATVANPALRTAAQRPARFLRIEKAVSIGDDDLGFPDIDFNAAVGSNVGFMREILGYAPIEPDGSVAVRVPANVAFMISVLDSNGRRIRAESTWLQIRAGEIRRCNGCHGSTGSHGRDGTFAPVDWLGASAAAGPRFPNTLAATAAAALQGDTMAQARARTTCSSGSMCSQQPSVNLLYDDVWTDPSPTAANRPADASFSYTYGTAGGFNTPPPVRTSCMATWTSSCRIIVNYEQHIHPLWSLPRGPAGANTCINCHAPADTTGVVQVPKGQLDLSGTPSTDQQLHMTAYRELLFDDNEQELAGGALQDRLVPGTDPDTGLPTLVNVNVQHSIIATSALGSPRFFNRFAVAGGTVDHRGFLTPAELRLISEWVDIGAQYYNNPIGLPAAFLN